MRILDQDIVALDIGALRCALLAWYDAHARDLPWRISPSARKAGRVPDPYHVWLSEIMLQQTTIATVKPYYAKFLNRFPDVASMARAPLEDVLSHWAGLGYYARARNMHKCAQVVDALGGFPASYTHLLELPGIGPYSGAAIGAIAFDLPLVPVDGNVERVLSRLLAIEDALPAAKPVFRQAAAAFEDTHRPGDFAQALMDLGSTVCTPKNPKCAECPWQGQCAKGGKADVEQYPRKIAKKGKRLLYGACFVHINEAGILVARRTDTGLLGGMLEVLGSPWRETVWSREEAMAHAPIPAQTWVSAAPVRHIFTHIDLHLDVYVAQSRKTDNLMRLAVEEIATAALPSVFLKVIKAGQSVVDGLPMT